MIFLISFCQILVLPLLHLHPFEHLSPCSKSATECMCASMSYQAAVAGVLHGADYTQLVQHFTHNDDAHPQRGQTGGHGPEASVGHGQRPEYHQDQVHH